MVLKFEEYINEGLWAKGIERSQTGEERLESKNPPDKFPVPEAEEYLFKIDKGKSVKTSLIEIYFKEHGLDEPVAHYEYPNIRKFRDSRYYITDDEGEKITEDMDSDSIEYEMDIEEDDDVYYDVLGMVTSTFFVENINKKIKELPVDIFK